MARSGRTRLPGPRQTSRTAPVRDLGAEFAGGSSFLRRRSTRSRQAADASARSILEMELPSQGTLAMVIADSPSHRR